MERIQDFSGFQYPFTSDPGPAQEEYNAHNVQYATSSHQKDHDMFPGLIVMPDNDNDIKNAIIHAKNNGYPIAVMSGGHQYSGACSTNQKGIQLNLSATYLGPQDLMILPQLPSPDSNRPLVYASVSQSLGVFNAFLQKNHLFVPHGQCKDVRLGGHVQTGGYGQLGRSFGLLGDHIWGVRMFDFNGQIQEVTRGQNQDLFYAILGGSPGNFGVITHYTIEVHRDIDHDFPRGPTPHGFKAIWLYNKKVLKLLLNEVAAMADDPEFPRNFDLCVNVLSSSFHIFKLMPELQDDMDDTFGSILEKIGVEWRNGVLEKAPWPACIVLYAQWAPMNAEDKYTDEVDAWFQKFRELNNFFRHGFIHGQDLIEPMSKMSGEWLFSGRREFAHPYDKRTYMTSSKTLVQDGWVDQVVDRIELVLNPLRHFILWQHCYLSVQIQCYGGKYSQYYANRENGTNYSWRDSTVCQILDCFYNGGETGRLLANGWQEENDRIMCGENSSYSKQDKRVLWASYGDWDMNNSWPFYYETQAKYENIGKQRHLADPNGTFTPNPFNVKAML